MTAEFPESNSADQSSLRRRTFLAAGAGIAATALAGCTAVVDFFAGLVLKDVNVFNGTARQVAGTITVTNPAGDTALEKRFDLASGAGEQNSDSTATYGNVLTDSGAYAVTVTLDGTEVNGEQSAERTIDVTSPDDQHIIVGIGSEDGDGITIQVIDELSDLKETTGS